MKRLGIILAHAVDGMMARLWPLNPNTRAYMPIDVLAKAEEAVEVWEPPLTNYADPDELWAAQQRFAIELANDQTIDEFVEANRHKLWPTTKAPASADDLAATASTYHSADGESPLGAAHSPAQGGADRVTTEEIATVIAVTLRGQGINSAPIYADLAARELAHHFEFSHK
jgi:hypothetical protein